MFSLGDIIPLRLRDTTTGAPTFVELANEWLRDVAAKHVRPEDARVHVNHLKALWSLTEKEMKPVVVRDALYALLVPDGPLSPTTVNKVLGTGKRIIADAQFRERWTGHNPFGLIKKLKQTKAVIRRLLLEEARAVVPHFRRDRQREALAMLYMGFRPGELKALQKVDVDARNKTLDIRRSNGRDSTKTGKARTVPIPDALWPVLEEAMRESPEGCPLVFPSKGGERQREDAKLSRALRTALGKAGLVTSYTYKCRRAGCGYFEERLSKSDPLWCPECNFKLWATPHAIRVRFYDLRHSAATLHREAGADPLAVQILLGHAAENLTDSCYTHLTPEYIRRELNKLKI